MNSTDPHSVSRSTNRLYSIPCLSYRHRWSIGVPILDWSGILPTTNSSIGLPLAIGNVHHYVHDCVMVAVVTHDHWFSQSHHLFHKNGNSHSVSIGCLPIRNSYLPFQLNLYDGYGRSPYSKCCFRSFPTNNQLHSYLRQIDAKRILRWIFIFEHLIAEIF